MKPMVPCGSSNSSKRKGEKKYFSLAPRLASSWTSILINGSPASEFSLKRGLRQGDPLSPFLFIIVKEDLHMAFNDALTANMFYGVKVGSPSWKANHLSIGGRLTLIKSVLDSLGNYYLSIFKVPEMVVKSLEILRAYFFLDSSEDSKKLAWVKWSNILASHDKGGLGVGSLKAFNMSLLLKWRWCLFIIRMLYGFMWLRRFMVMKRVLILEVVTLIGLVMAVPFAFGKILGYATILSILDITYYITWKNIKIVLFNNALQMVLGFGALELDVNMEEQRLNSSNLFPVSPNLKLKSYVILILCIGVFLMTTNFR
ncbi:hypothetical protein Tco_0484993 [Tanacetum coccineum]